MYFAPPIAYDEVMKDISLFKKEELILRYYVKDYEKSMFEL